MTDYPLTPLLAPGSALDARQRQVIAQVAREEYAKILELPTDDPLDPKRRYRTEVTRDELVAQPAAIQATWARNAASLPDVAARLAGAGVTKAFLAGAGDSLAVMQAARQLLELALGVPCEPVQSLDLAYYLDHLIDSKTLVMALSSSGRTTRTVEAALVAQHRGAVTLALTNSPGSPLDTECEDTLLIEATRVGWPTQASTAALALLQRLALAVGQARGVEVLAGLDGVLDTLPGVMGDVIAQVEPVVARIAEAEAPGDEFVFAGGGPNWPCAVIGAAKVRECSPSHAQALQIEEFHHYNSLKADEPLWVIAPEGRTVPRALDTVREAKRYGGRAYVVTSQGVDCFDGVADAVLSLPAVPEVLSPLVYVVPVQLFGYHVAMAKFRAAEREVGR
ncbi:MAG: SIS domain-containing protein [Bifidobacteriaceae bacterium]|jgi:glucosamine 6-phosphate synthetase-like amidotransferase/phosphosugar isomerase protein|nr:SIS domain-containing protein [Bifidobacteriaceae bacterium]